MGRQERVNPHFSTLDVYKLYATIYWCFVAKVNRMFLKLFVKRAVCLNKLCLASYLIVQTATNGPKQRIK